jgi:hypothetical protein
MAMSRWEWTGNHKDAPSAAAFANARGCGAGEAIFAVNDGGTVGLYVLDNPKGSLGNQWEWTGNHQDAPSAAAFASAAGCGAGEAVYAVNDGGTVGLYLLK